MRPSELHLRKGGNTHTEREKVITGAEKTKPMRHVFDRAEALHGRISRDILQRILNELVLTKMTELQSNLYNPFEKFNYLLQIVYLKESSFHQNKKSQKA